jgi:hypothetical protein
MEMNVATVKNANVSEETDRVQSFPNKRKEMLSNS